jgi:peroxiredoxin
VAHDPTVLPPDLPVPVDDGAADHLAGAQVPSVALPSTDGRSVILASQESERVVVYAYPRTGRPGVPELVPDWDHIPGARGCTPESCGFRDHHQEITALGAEVFGLSAQSTDDQREAVERLGLPFPLLSDAGLRLAEALGLPTFEVAGHRLLKRLTFVVRDGRIERVWYPVFPPDTHAAEVVDWLRQLRP